MQFAKGDGLGYNQNNIWSTSLYDQEVQSKIEDFKSELTSHSSIASVSVSSGLLTEVGWMPNIDWKGKNEDDNFPFFKLVVDYDFLDGLI